MSRVPSKSVFLEDFVARLDTMRWMAHELLIRALREHCWGIAGRISAIYDLVVKTQDLFQCEEPFGDSLRSPMKIIGKYETLNEVNNNGLS